MNMPSVVLIQSRVFGGKWQYPARNRLSETLPVLQQKHPAFAKTPCQEFLHL
jgi:hypothetical protein